MIDLSNFDESAVQALCNSLLEGVASATRIGGEATWRRHFRSSMPMSIG